MSSKNYSVTNIQSSNPSLTKHNPNRKLPPLPHDSRPPPLPGRGSIIPKTADLLNAPPAVPRRKSIAQPAPTQITASSRTRSVSDTNAPPLPNRNRSLWTQPNNVFEERFRFHKSTEFPTPNAIALAKKHYPSQQKKSSPNQRPPPPPSKDEDSGTIFNHVRM